MYIKRIDQKYYKSGKKYSNIARHKKGKRQLWVKKGNKFYRQSLNNIKAAGNRGNFSVYASYSDGKKTYVGKYISGKYIPKSKNTYSKGYKKGTSKTKKGIKKMYRVVVSSILLGDKNFHFSSLSAAVNKVNKDGGVIKIYNRRTNRYNLPKK